MDCAELTRVFPWLVEQYLDDASTPQPISPAPIHEAHPSWSFMNGQTLAVGAISTEAGQLRVTHGLAMDVPYTAEVSHAINRINNKELLFGRMFLFGNEESGLGCVVMQEIFLADSLSEDHPPSLQNLLRVLASMGAHSARLAPQLREQFGGKPFADEAAFFLQVNA